ncbi:MAG TPA: TonB-dependent receptor [Chitinophagales bacterium]|nr:TonB-dependent receptor [Chitinophagales bacterium]HNK97492.1 TonB-dependent receptor [Chitinophagales bacterium]
MFCKNVAFLIAFCLLSLFTQQSLSAQSYAISGIVIDETSGLGLQDVVVTINNQQIISDKRGNFITQSNSKQLIIDCSMIGYSLINIPVIQIDTQAHKIDITIKLTRNLIELPNFEITAQRVATTMPVTHTNIYASQLEQINLGRDMPFLLESVPSTVATSDAGNGVGYSGLRIRGSDATRINITINGVPYNDAESQQTYWVDLPDFASSVEDIQIQRGIGITNNGLSAFGASININTNNLNKETGAFVQSSVGSFGLRKFSGGYQSGLINEHWYIQGRASIMHSDGYIDRAFADLGAWFMTGAYKGNKYTSIVNVFSGKERTYQAWGGVPAEVLDTNRTYNPYTYENQTDNYRQTHVQWHQYFNVTNRDNLRLTLNYTKGSGYYEQLEEDQDFGDYGIEPVLIGADTISNADLITQKWLDNDFYGAFLQYKHRHSNNWNTSTGATFYRYTGTHFGKVIWNEFASTMGYDYTWYTNDAEKSDGSVYLQSDIKVGNILYLVDLQARYVGYQFLGYNVEGLPVDQNVAIYSFNPKVGLSFFHGFKSKAYLFVGMSTKEPNRDDYTESTPLSRPVPEKMIDVEIGDKLELDKFRISANYFMMYYIDQLVLTGEINDVGAYTRTNIPRSYRTGLEVEYRYRIFPMLFLNGNVTYSINKALDYVAYIDNWDDGTQVPVAYASADLAFSPEWITYNQLYGKIWDKNAASSTRYLLTATWTSKTVGQQYVDNTSDGLRSLDAYWLNDVGLNMMITAKRFKEMNISLQALNVFNKAYASNAWVYTYQYGGEIQQMMGYYPQAGINWQLGFSLKL